MDKVRKLSILPIDNSCADSISPLLAGDGLGYIIEGGCMPVVKVIDKVLHIMFPTPDKLDEQKKCSTLVAKTQKMILNAPRANSVVLDLRGNIGGDFSLFYGSLYPILPELRVQGDRNGVEIAEIFDDGKYLIIRATVDVYKSHVQRCRKLNLPVTVIVNERSMSSAQLIAILISANGGTLIGSAPANYTNGTLTDGIANVISYNFKYKNIVYYGLPPQSPILIKETQRYKAVSVEHERAIANNELYDDSYHYFYTNKGPPSCGIIGSAVWCYFPYIKKFIVKDHIKEYQDVWTTILGHYRAGNRIILDLRGLRQDGPELVFMLSPFIKTTAIEVIGGEPLVLANRHIEKATLTTRSVCNEMADAKLIVLVDDKFGHFRDKYSTMLFAYFCKYHTVYGKPRKNFQYIYTRHFINGLVVKIPTIQLLNNYSPKKIIHATT